MSSRGTARTGASPHRRCRRLHRTWLPPHGPDAGPGYVLSDLLEPECDGFIPVVVGVDRVGDEPDRLAELVVLEVLEVTVEQVRLHVAAAVEVDDRGDEAVAECAALHDRERPQRAGGGQRLGC